MKKVIDIARGISKADLVLKNAQIVNVYTGSIEQGDIAISDGIIAGIGLYEGIEEVDLSNQYVFPGLIDSHIHIESSMLTPSRFSKAIIPYGVTTVIADPHEIANVSGTEGIRFMINDAKGSEVDFKFMLPSCVPATDFETSGATLDSTVIKSLIKDNCILGLGEMMNYPGVLNGNDEVISKIQSANSCSKIIDGHAPELSGLDLNAYVACGIKTDHEASTIEEALEKISRGMYILIREGTAAKNLLSLIPLANTEAWRRLMFCSDDCHPYDLINYGTINHSIKLAIENGINPIRAITIATLNAAECYGLSDRGAIAPGLIADLVITDDLINMNINRVYKSGQLVAYKGVAVNNREEAQTINDTSFNCKKIKLSDISLYLKGETLNVIGLIPNSILTDKMIINSKDMDKSKDILKICVVERHINSGNIGIGLANGYGIKNGAVATSIAHDSHNIIAIGDNDKDIVNAVNEIIRVGGGITISSDNKIMGTLELNISGLMSDKSVVDVNNKYEELVNIARSMGVPEGIHPFMTLSFLALPVIPHLKLTDKGLFDVDKFDFIHIEN